MNQVRIERTGWDTFNVFYYGVFYGSAFRRNLVHVVQRSVGTNNRNPDRDRAVQEFADDPSSKNILEVSR